VRVVSETLQLDAAGACLFSYLLKAEPDVYSDALCRACAPHAPAHRTTSHLRIEWRTPFREPLQFIVMTVTVVTLPTPMRFLSDSPLSGSAIYRHTYRHREKPFSMRFST
jgi:hypothetical protein